MMRGKQGGGPQPLVPFSIRADQVRSRISSESIRAVFSRVVARVDEQELEAKKSCYDIAGMLDASNASAVKYFDVPHYVEVAATRAEQAGLFGSTALRVLDLGAGAGCFAACCEELGHQAVASDAIRPGIFNSIYADICSALGIPRYPCEVARMQPLPIAERFDVVTAQAIVFGSGWTTEDWLYLVTDIRTRLLQPDGKIRFVFNQGLIRDFDEFTATLRTLNVTVAQWARTVEVSNVSA